jgi:hypothetical protein
MKNSTKIRLHLSKNLFESLAKQVLAESKKSNMSGGAYTEAVKAPKTHKEKSPEGKKTDEMKTGKMKSMGEMETRVAEAGMGVEYAWIPAALAGVAISATVLKNIIAHMKQHGLEGMKGLIQAYKEVGQETSSAIEKSTGAGSKELGAFGGKSFDFGKKKD